MQYDTRLACVIKMEPVPAYDLEKVNCGEHPIGWRLNMIT